MFRCEVDVGEVFRLEENRPIVGLIEVIEDWAGERSADSVSRNIQGVVDGDAREWVVQDV